MNITLNDSINCKHNTFNKNNKKNFTLTDCYNIPGYIVLS